LVSLAPAAALPLAPVLVEVLDWPLVLPLAEDEEGVVVWELVLPLADGVVVVCELVLLLPPAAAEPLVEVDGVCALVLPLAEDDGVLCELVLPLAAPRSRRQRSFSAAIMLSQLLAAMPPAAALPDDAPLVCAPVLPDEVWANEALDSARSAAAVALARSFRFIWMLLSRIGWSECSASHANSVPVHPAAPAPKEPVLGMARQTCGVTGRQRRQRIGRRQRCRTDRLQREALLRRPGAGAAALAGRGARAAARRARA
jgi:hypothetical protein